jgi:hypothetical protein
MELPKCNKAKLKEIPGNFRLQASGLTLKFLSATAKSVGVCR